MQPLTVIQGSQWFLETEIETITKQICSTHSGVASCKDWGLGPCTNWNIRSSLGLSLFQLRSVHLFPGYFPSKQAAEVPSQGPVNSSTCNIHHLLWTGPINYNVQEAPPEPRIVPVCSRTPSHPRLAAPGLTPAQKCHWDPGAAFLQNWWLGWRGAEVQGVLQKHGAWSAQKGERSAAEMPPNTDSAVLLPASREAAAPQNRQLLPELPHSQRTSTSFSFLEKLTITKWHQTKLFCDLKGLSNSTLPPSASVTQQANHYKTATVLCILSKFLTCLKKGWLRRAPALGL